MPIETKKIRTKNPNVYLRVAQGHFATMHIHTNYFIDVTIQKMRLADIKAVAKVQRISEQALLLTVFSVLTVWKR